MRLVVLLTLAFGSTAVAAAGGDGLPDQPKVGVLRFAEVEVGAEFAGSVANVVANELDRTGAFKVTTAQAIGDLLALERQKQLMGCAEENETCMAEIVDALGLDLMVSGKVIKLGDGAKARWTLDLTMTNVRKGRRESSQVVTASSRQELLEQARSAARQLVANILRARSGLLALVVSEAGATVKVDDIAVGVSPLAAPLPVSAGSHRVQVEKKGFLAAEVQPRVAPNATTRQEIRLVPSEEYAREYETGAKRMRLGAWISSGVAVVGALAGAGLQARAALLYGDASTPDTFQYYRAQLGATPTDAELRQKATELGADIHTSEVISQVSFTAAGVGAAAAAFFWIVGEDPGRYANKAGVKASLAPAPGGVGIAVSF